MAEKPLDLEHLRAVVDLVLGSSPWRTEILQGVETQVASREDSDFHIAALRKFENAFYPGRCLDLLDMIDQLVAQIEELSKR